MTTGQTSVLDDIVKKKRAYVDACQQARPLSVIKTALHQAPAIRPFAIRLREIAATGKPAIIAEIKQASPSKGRLRLNYDPQSHARAYQQAGAAALSVLTDTPYFMGRDDDLVAARAACDLPVLRKDFMIDAYQVYEARVLGADCILLIMACLDDKTALDLALLAADLGMDVLIEVHDLPELERALALPCPEACIGVNNRNLKTLAVDIATSHDLIRQIPAGRLSVSESGLTQRQELEMLTKAGFQAFLMGERFMTQPDPGQALLTFLAEQI